MMEKKADTLRQISIFRPTHLFDFRAKNQDFNFKIRKNPGKIQEKIEKNPGEVLNKIKIQKIITFKKIQFFDKIDFCPCVKLNFWFTTTILIDFIPVRVKAPSTKSTELFLTSSVEIVSRSSVCAAKGPEWTSTIVPILKRNKIKSSKHNLQNITKILSFDEIFSETRNS